MIYDYYFCQILHLQSNTHLCIKPLNIHTTGIHSTSPYPSGALKHPYCVGLGLVQFFFTKKAI